MGPRRAPLGLFRRLCDGSQRPRTLWFWALALRENTDLLDKIKHLSLCFRPAPDSSPPPSENPPAYSLPRTQLALLDIEAAARAQLFPSAALPPPGVLEALRPPPRLPEAVVAWAARRRGAPSIFCSNPCGNGPPGGVLRRRRRARRGRGRPWDPDLTRALLEFSDSLRAAPPGRANRIVKSPGMAHCRSGSSSGGFMPWARRKPAPSPRGWSAPPRSICASIR
jgi:hypothetical protein